MRVIGIDPGTTSFDLFGMDGEESIVDLSIPSTKVAQSPEALLDILRELSPVDIIVGPSGYGLPLVSIRDASSRELSLMRPPEDEGVSVNEGIRQMFRLMRKEGLPGIFTPGVIHLATVPTYRKINKMDMGTADKVCVVALGIKDQAEYFGVGHTETSFILVEIGYGFTAIIGVVDGEVVDGLGGTSGPPGFLSLGAMDSELAIRFGKCPQSVLFTGGIKDVAGKEDLTPEELAQDAESYPEAWELLLEGLVKGVAAMMVSVGKPREFLLSGRLTRLPELVAALESRLSRLGKVRRIRRQAKVAKEAAEGAYIIGEGLMEGKYKGIVDALKLRKAKGTMYDYILLRGTDLVYP